MFSFQTAAGLLCALSLTGLSQAQSLQTNTDSINVVTGGVQTFLLDAGPQFAGDTYLMLGTASGTTPGTVVAGLNLPLNVDLYTRQTLVGPNQAPWVDSLGLLDTGGQAQASLSIAADSPLSLVGLRLDHAYVLLDASAPGDPVVGVSPSAPLTLSDTFFKLVECSLGCSGPELGPFVCGVTDVFENEVFSLTFSEPVDLSSASSATAGLVDVATGIPATGTYSLDPNDPRTLRFTPSAGLTPNAVYRLFLPGTMNSLTPFVKSATGLSNLIELDCFVIASKGIQP